jgi:hypothetical protein
MKNFKSVFAGACLALLGTLPMQANAQWQDSFYNPAGEDGSCGAANHYEYQMNGDYYLWEVPALGNGQSTGVSAYYYYSSGGWSHGGWNISFTCIDGTIYGGSGSHEWEPA